jgi:hypothetical protein
MRKNIAIDLTEQEALVLFEFLHRGVDEGRYSFAINPKSVSSGH